ncbi:MAG: NADPH:quinone oxidoreductase [Geminicoccaceae bacterium]|jgi:NADPH2:quinone reductase|nr:NADPH:quinone oxidoreductase [Geminicoccaceae bacterium]
MKAAFYTKYGAARDVLTIGELPDPQPGAGAVRVRVRFSGINPSDCNRRLGIRDRPGYPLIVPHSDGSGEIDAVGEGVSRSRIGEKVWIWNAQRGRPFGTAAEYVALPSRQAVRLPDGATLEDGACFGVPAMTAYYSLFDDGALEGKDVLVTGGAGAVGFYAVQFARLAGARTLVATVSSDEKARMAEKAGAPVVVNYKIEDVARRIMEATDGRGIDHISEVDFGGNLKTTLAVMKVGCAIGAYASKGAPEPALPFYPLLFSNVVVRFIQCYAMPDDVRLPAHRDLTRWCEDGKLEHPPARILPLANVAEAHELVEEGKVIGKVMLRV